MSQQNDRIAQTSDRPSPFTTAEVSRAADGNGRTSPTTTSLLLLDERVLAICAPDRSLEEHLLDAIAAEDVRAGDVLLTCLADGVALDAVDGVLSGCDHVIRRTSSVTDIYRCSLADRIMTMIGVAPAHHTQLRRFMLEGVNVLQVALYPRPPASHGVRLWCDHALIWLFVETSDRRSQALTRLHRLQPSWERLRAHHGTPLEQPQDERLTGRYPVEDPLTPISVAERDEIDQAVGMLVGQSCVRSLIAGDITPREAVDSTLRGRRALARHLDRLDKVLEHSHGRAEDKLSLLKESTGQALVDTSEAALKHFIAPYEHLVAGLRETRRQVASAVDGASTTTALISSAAVGRLLDRSDANRRATTAAAMTAFFIAVLTSFSALASVPQVDRVVMNLVRLGGWVGAGCLLVLLCSYLLARVAAMPAAAAPEVVRRHAPLLIVLSIVAAMAMSVVGAVTGSLAAVVAAGVLATVATFLRAWSDDY